MRTQISIISAESTSSQIGADLWCLDKLGFKSGGFFVEVGSHHPRHLSNTYWLEKTLGWRGIVMDPLPGTSEKFNQERLSMFVPGAAVSSSNASSELEFCFVVSKPELSRLRDVIPEDPHEQSGARADHEIIRVPVFTLEGVLHENQAPSVIDFVSIDTEGSEVEVLEGMDFRNRVYRTLAIEMAGDSKKEKLVDELLIPLGYHKESTSKSRWDSWYYLSGL